MRGLGTMTPARITVSRQSPDDIRQRQVVLKLDGEPWAKLLYGDTATREVEPGPHRLRVHNTLVWKTVDMDLPRGEHARFTVANRAGWGTYWMVGIFGAGPLYVTVTREPDPPPRL